MRMMTGLLLLAPPGPVREACAERDHALERAAQLHRVRSLSIVLTRK
jgi:hypothetical protein